jgi:hypothetical protein
MASEQQLRKAPKSVHIECQVVVDIVKQALTHAVAGVISVNK